LERHCPKILDMRLLSSSSPHIKVAPPTPKSIFVGGAAMLTAAATLFYSPTSAADTIIGVQGNINTLVEPSREGTGAGIDVLLGKRLDLTLVTFGTELSLGLHSLPGADKATAYRALAGVNLGIGSILRPSIFAHIGVGHIAVADDSIPDQSRTGLAGDAGVALDFTLLPLLDIGVQGSYNAISKTSDTDPFRWLQAGVHATLVL
jgi:hypothetical protein